MAEKQKNEVATQEKNEIAVPENVMQSLKIAGVETEGMTPAEIMEFAQFFVQEMETSREGAVLRPSRIKINKDACAFIDPSGQNIEELKGVIVYKQITRGYWLRDADDNVPECSSVNGTTGVTRDGQERNCANCPMNQWGSGEDEAGNATAGKACKEMRRVFMVLPGYQLPAYLSLPPTSLRNFDDYISARLTKGLADVAAETVITLTPEKGGKYSYAVARFRLGDPVPPKEMMRFAKMRSALMQAAKEMGVDEADYMQDDDPIDVSAEDVGEEEPF